MADAYAVLPPITQSPEDKRTFRLIRLVPNGLVALLCRDADIPPSSPVEYDASKTPLAFSSVTIDADFEDYDGGIYRQTSRTSLGGHAIRLVGWGTEDGVDYWKVANSWNPYWGEDGYFRIVRGTNEGGLEQNAVAAAANSTWGLMSAL